MSDVWAQGLAGRYGQAGSNINVRAGENVWGFGTVPRGREAEFTHKQEAPLPDNAAYSNLLARMRRPGEVTKGEFAAYRKRLKRNFGPVSDRKRLRADDVREEQRAEREDARAQAERMQAAQIAGDKGTAEAVAFAKTAEGQADLQNRMTVIKYTKDYDQAVKEDRIQDAQVAATKLVWMNPGVREKISKASQEERQQFQEALNSYVQLNIDKAFDPNAAIQFVFGT